MRELRSVVRQYCFIFVCLAFATLDATSAQRPPNPNIRSLMAQLSDIRTTSRDVGAQVLEVARNDSDARDYVVHSLPGMIQAATDEVWLNAVWLAGQMKATEAVPSLMQAMSRRSFPAETFITGGGVMRLDHDIVAKALSQIGDPAIPSVSNLLKSAEAGTRGRAILILRNMNSPAARNVLRDHLSGETDQSLKEWIKEALKSPTP
jgi:HEAT repeat protein